MRKRLLSLMLAFMVSFACASFAGCDEVIEYHEILATSSNLSKAGVTSGSGNYTTNSEVTLVAIPKLDHEFIAWTKDNLVISYQPTYTFKANSETEGKYIALFSTNELEFAMLDNIEYEINDILHKNENITPSKIISWDLKCNEISALYKDLATFEDITIPTSYSYLNDNIAPIKKVFFMDRTYFFTISITFEYNNSEISSTLTETITTNFSIDFSNLTSSSATINGTSATFSCESYKIEQYADNENNYFVDTSVYCLSKSTNWSEDTKYNTQSLKLHFTYPFTDTENK